MRPIPTKEIFSQETIYEKWRSKRRDYQAKYNKALANFEWMSIKDSTRVEESKARLNSMRARAPKATVTFVEFDTVFNRPSKNDFIPMRIPLYEIFRAILTCPTTFKKLGYIMSPNFQVNEKNIVAILNTVLQMEWKKCTPRESPIRVRSKSVKVYDHVYEFPLRTPNRNRHTAMKIFDPNSNNDY